MEIESYEKNIANWTTMDLNQIDQQKSESFIIFYLLFWLL